jgi:hypothetical protein
MRAGLKTACAAAMAALAPGAGTAAAAPPERASASAAAWAAWQAGDAADALRLGERLASDPATADEGGHVVVLAAHVLGRYDEAIAAYGRIDSSYGRRKELRHAVYESYLHLGRAPEALRYADESAMPASAKQRAQALVDAPLSVSMAGLVSLGFHQDALTPHMPGVAGSVNGMPAVLRFDTGGTFVVMSPALATRHQVQSHECAQGFANLQATQVCYGAANLELGPVRVVNAPVAVVSSLPAEVLGVPLGPVLGTNLLAQFLATIDAPGQRLLLSRRGDEQAKTLHMNALGPSRSEIPFLLWSDHFIIARGGAGAHGDLNFFVDSGLVAVAEDGEQAGLLVPQSEAAAWAGVNDPGAVGTMVPVALPIRLGPASRSGQRAMILPDAAWKSFGTFGGIRVNALISYGFLKRQAWTLDFDRRVIVLSGGGAPAPGSAAGG